MSIFDSIKHSLEKALHSVSGAATSAVHKVQGAATEAEHKAVAGILSAEHKAVASIQAEAEKVKAAAKGQIGELMHAALTAALQRSLALLAASIPDSVTVQLGPVGFEVDDMTHHVEALKAAIAKAEHGSVSMDTVKAVIAAAAPDTVFVSFDAEFAELFVTSSDEGVAFQATWETDRFLADMSKIIKTF